MGIIKNLFASVENAFNSVATKLQNNEALVQQSLYALENEIAVSTAALKRLEESVNKTKQQLQDAVALEEDLKRRAVALATECDKKAALECLRTAHRQRSLAISLQEQLAQAEVSVQKVQSALDSTKKSFDTLSLRQKQMSAEQAIRADRPEIQSSTSKNAQHILDEWEKTLGLTKGSGGTKVDCNTRNTEEEMAALEEELEALIQANR